MTLGDYYSFSGVVSVENTGEVSAKHVLVSLNFTKLYDISFFGVDGNSNTGMKKLPSTGPQRKFLYSSGSDLVLHPGTTNQIDRIVVNEISNRVEFDFVVLVIHYTLNAEGMKQKSDSITLTIRELMEEFPPFKSL